jgi:hypothetical protein
MPSGIDSRMQDLETFARALENILRKLIRFLVGRISLLKLNEMVRNIYIQEAERQLKLEQPTKSVSLSKLGVLTGIDTRTLTKVRNSEEYWSPLHKTKRFLKEMTPEGCILDMWSSDSRYLDSKTGQPRPLKMSQGKNSFEQLVSEAVSSRGVTAQSLLEKLISNGAVNLIEDSNEVELVEAFFGPFKSGDAISTLEVGLSFVERQMDTVFHNYDAIIQGEEPFYDRIWFTNHLDPKNRSKLQKTLNSVLKKAHEEVREVLSSVEENFSSDDHLVAGVGMYYIELLPDSNNI